MIFMILPSQLRKSGHPEMIIWMGFLGNTESNFNPGTPKLFVLPLNHLVYFCTFEKCVRFTRNTHLKISLKITRFVFIKTSVLSHESLHYRTVDVSFRVLLE